MRAEEAESVGDSHVHFHTTARTLLSILRLSQALARLRFADEVSQPDVDEAIRLMFVSKISIHDETSTARNVNPFSGIFQIIKDKSLQTNSPVVRLEDVRQRIIAKGFPERDLNVDAPWTLTLLTHRRRCWMSTTASTCGKFLKIGKRFGLLMCRPSVSMVAVATAMIELGASSTVAPPTDHSFFGFALVEGAGAGERPLMREYAHADTSEMVRPIALCPVQLRTESCQALPSNTLTGAQIRSR